MGRLEIVITSKEERDFLVLQSLSFMYTKLTDKGSRPQVPPPPKKKGRVTADSILHAMILLNFCWFRYTSFLHSI